MNRPLSYLSDTALDEALSVALRYAQPRIVHLGGALDDTDTRAVPRIVKNLLWEYVARNERNVYQ